MSCRYLSAMADAGPQSVNAETLELLSWFSSRARTYPEGVEAWRSNCPNHAVWDDAITDGLVQVVSRAGGRQVILTAAGKALLEQSQPVEPRE